VADVCVPERLPADVTLWPKCTGPIPPSLVSAPRLSKLVLSNNLLTGIIPASLARVPTISVLLLNNNDFEGEIPSFAEV
jgi:hypothetical protein